MVDLHGQIPADSGWTVDVARAINASGQIVVTGYHDGNRSAALMTPNDAGTAEADDGQARTMLSEPTMLGYRIAERARTRRAQP
jgi:hypothetical protein